MKRAGPPEGGPRAPAALALSALVLLAACGAGSAPHDPPCASDEYEYVDQLCEAPAQDGTSQCSTVGDGLCYQRCETGSDCSGGYRCVRIGLFAGHDWNCTDTVRVCADREDADCP